MQFDVIRTEPGFASLASEWNSLLTKSASDVPFLRHEYLSAWWPTRGGGEWQQGELFIVTARDSSGELVGIAPLFFGPNLMGQPALMFLGSIEISDYLDFITAPADLPAFLNGLLSFLCSPAAPAWQVLDFYNLLESSPSLPVLRDLASQRGLKLAEEPLQHCPYIPLPADFESYLAGIDKKQRHEIRRKLRRAEANPVPVRWYITEDSALLDDDLEAFFALMHMDPQKHTFLTAPMREEMHLAMQAAFQHGWLQLSFLEVGGEKAAAHLSFDYGGRLWLYNSGYDPFYKELSVGWLLLAYMIDWGTSHGRTSFDFMRGDEEYKYRFGAIDRRIYRLTVSR